MARIRTIKPELPQSESMGKVSRESRLLFILTWTLADDSGRLRGSSRMLASLLFPYDDDASALIDGWLNELVDEDCIQVYAIDGSTYIQIAKWLNHQKIDKPSPSKIPPFDEASRILANPRGGIKDQGSRIKEGIKDQDQGPATPPKPSASPELFDGIDPQVVADFKALRNKKKVAITKTAIEGIKREADIASISLEAALTMCCERGWIGFKAEWVTNATKPQAKPADLAAINARNNAEAKRLLFGSDEDEMRTIDA